MVRRRGNGSIGLPTRRLHRGRNQVVLEITAKNVTIFVVRYLLVQRRGKSLRQATVNLSLDDHRVDHRTTVIHRHEAANMYLACTTIDIDDTDIATERIGKVGRIVVVDRLKSWLQARRAVGIGGKSQFLDGLALAWGTLDVETPWFPFEVLLPYFQQVGSDFLGFVTYFTRSYCCCRTSDRRATTGVRSKAIGGGIGIAMFDINIIRGHAEFGGD